jgi:hypothetical protein
MICQLLTISNYVLFYIKYLFNVFGLGHFEERYSLHVVLRHCRQLPAKRCAETMPRKNCEAHNVRI